MTRGPVDVEAIVIDYLNANTGATAAGSFPRNLRATLPFIRVGAAGGTTVDRQTGRLWRARIDLDARGADQGETFDTVAEAITALLELNDTPYAHAAGVITAVEVDLAPLRSPDPETDDERYLATLAVYAHRGPAAGS